jgi:hypothetical protein
MIDNKITTIIAITDKNNDIIYRSIIYIGESMPIDDQPAVDFTLQ